LVRAITSNVRNAGIYHVGLGTWTRHVDPTQSNLDVIYSNTCPTGYFAGLLTKEYIADEGRIPSPHGRVVCDSGLHSKNEGCGFSYNIEAFQIAYCSGLRGAHTVDLNIGFQQYYTACAVPADLPKSANTFDLIGLPGAASTIQGCWLVTVDLDAASLTLTNFAADGAICPLATNETPLFGWTFQNQSQVTGVGTSYVGPIIAGNGGPAAPAGGCSMVDNTRWDTLTCTPQGGGPAKWPNNLTEDGWGMDTEDQFRDDTTNSSGGALSVASGPGCYFFGGDPRASFHLRVFANVGCGTGGPGEEFCRPIENSLTCPCANQPTTPGAGCNSLSPPAPGTPTGGAKLGKCGNAIPYDVGTDTLMLDVAGLPTAPNESAYLLQGTMSIAPVQFGQGLRCCGGALKRLQIHSPAPGASRWPAAGDFYPTISERSNNPPGTPVHILPGQTYCYFIQYRQSLYSGGCALPLNFNASSALTVTWHP
jgi:hypothetical protein